MLEQHHNLPIHLKLVFTIIPFIYVAYILKKKCCGLSNAKTLDIGNEKLETSVSSQIQ